MKQRQDTVYNYVTPVFFPLAVDVDLVGVCFPSICGVNNLWILKMLFSTKTTNAQIFNKNKNKEGSTQEKRGKKKVKQHLCNKSIDKIKPQIDKTKTNRTILKECTYIVSEEIFKWIMKIIGNATISLLYICLMANL